MKCRWNQFWINWHIDDGSPLSTHVRSHVNVCPRCQAVYREQVHLQEQLLAPVADQISPSPYLKSRILNQISGEEQSRPTSARLRWIGTGVFAAIAIALTITAIRPDPELSSLQTAGVAPATGWVEITAKMTSGENLFRMATNLNQPLHQELDLVIKDAQAVFNSLANDFVPSTLLASSD